jgi:hypothetical protein
LVDEFGNIYLRHLVHAVCRKTTSAGTVIGTLQVIAEMRVTFSRARLAFVAESRGSAPLSEARDTVWPPNNKRPLLCAKSLCALALQVSQQTCG